VFLLRVQSGLRPNFWSLTAILILNAWTRLDSALLSATVYTFCLLAFASSYRNNIRLFLERQRKAIVGTVLFATTGFILQLGAFWLMGGSFLPVSALVKLSGASRHLPWESAGKLIEVLLLGMPSIVQGRLPAAALALFGLVGILVVLRARISGDGSRAWNAILALWSYLLVGELLYHTFVGVSGVQYTPYFIWYRSPSFVFWILTASLAVLSVLDKARQIEALSRAARWAPAALSFALFATAIYMFARSSNFTSQLYVARYQAALWIADNAPPDTVFAAWNTGQLGYFSDRTFIKLDGVINSVDYYQRILRGATPLADYLAENNVDYIVDYAIYAPIPDFPVVHTFPISEESERSIHIWQVSAQSSTAR
jgi:hypothetical protein